MIIRWWPLITQPQDLGLPKKWALASARRKYECTKDAKFKEIGDLIIEKYTGTEKSLIPYPVSRTPFFSYLLLLTAVAVGDLFTTHSSPLSSLPSPKT